MLSNQLIQKISKNALRCSRRRKRRQHFDYEGVSALQYDGGVEEKSCWQHFLEVCCCCCLDQEEGQAAGGGKQKPKKIAQPGSSTDSPEKQIQLANAAKGVDLEKNEGASKKGAGDLQTGQSPAQDEEEELVEDDERVNNRTSNVPEEVRASAMSKQPSEVSLQEIQVGSTEQRIQELGIEIDTDDKASLQKMKCNLLSLIVVVNQMKKKLVKAKGQNVILAVGSTGCGKSTMLNALIWGPESLEPKKIQQNIELKGGKTKTLSRMVIESKNPRQDFKIGHSASKSETFLPHFYKMSKIDSMFVDLAGLEDTSGQFISLINCFISKYIFDYARNVRFLVPLTKEATQNARGSQIKDLLRTMQHICSKELDDVVGAMQPVITRVKPGDDDETDIYELRQTVQSQLETELQAWVNQHLNKEKDGEQIELQRQLYENFTEKMELYDPLDRPLPNADDPQSITTAELLERIVNLTPIEGSHLNAPIPTKSMSLLQQMFRIDFEACDELADAYIQQAKEEGKKFKKEFREEKIVQDFQLVLDFFAENALLTDATKKQQEFRDYIYGDSGIMELIRDAKEFTGYNKASQEIFLYMQGVFKFKRKHEELVKQMIKLQDCIVSKKAAEKLDDIEAQSAMDHMLSKASRLLEQIVIDLNQDPLKLINFCYYLRKIDVDNKYSFDFLNGQVRPAVLVDIICANKWDSVHQQMKYDVKTEFLIHIGNENRAMEVNYDGGLPFIVDEAADDTRFWFKLEEGGFVITNGAHCLASADAEVPQGGQCLAEFKTNPSQTSKQGSGKEFLWNLVSSADRYDYQDYPYFHIEMTYGDVKPRLLYQKSTIMSSKIVVSTRTKQKEFSSPEASVWKIFKVSKM